MGSAKRTISPSSRLITTGLALASEPPTLARAQPKPSGGAADLRIAQAAEVVGEDQADADESHHHAG